MDPTNFWSRIFFPHTYYTKIGIVLQAYSEVISEQDAPGPYKAQELPARYKRSIEKRYGKIHPKDFFSRDLDTYFKFI